MIGAAALEPDYDDKLAMCSTSELYTVALLREVRDEKCSPSGRGSNRPCSSPCLRLNPTHRGGFDCHTRGRPFPDSLVVAQLAEP